MNGWINLLDKWETIKKIKWKVWAKTKPKENTHNNYIDFKTIPIREVISKYVPLYNDPNRNIRCPFPDHDDKSPSFKIYHNTNSFYCFWCGKWWNTANFIAEIENITFKEAIKKLILTYK